MPDTSSRSSPTCWTLQHALPLAFQTDRRSTDPLAATSGSLERIRNRVPEPASSVLAGRLRDLRAQPVTVDALMLAGRQAEVLVLARTLEPVADDIGHDPLSAELHLALAVLLGSSGDSIASSEHARVAMTAARASHHWPVAAEAAASLVFSQGYLSADRLHQDELVRQTEALVRAAGSESELEALYEEMVGIIHLSRGNSQRSIDAFERSISVRSEAGITHEYDALMAKMNVATNLTNLGRSEQALAQYRSTLTPWLSLYGEMHFQVAFLYANLSR